MNHMEMSENMIRYANRITKPFGSGSSPADIALIILLACDSGRSSITCLKPLGICSVEKNVLHRNDIGMMMYEVYLGVSL